MKIGGAALNQTPLDWGNNFNNIIEAIQLAQNDGIELLCLPELCITGYGCEDVFLGEWIYPKSIDLLLKIVPYTKEITVSIGLPVLFNNKRYNCACLISNQTILGFSAKQFLANDGVHYEPRWFTPWQADKIDQIEVNNSFYPFGDVIYELKGKKIAFEICEDAWHIDNRPALRHYVKKVDIILNPSASHFAFGKTQLRNKLVESSSEKYQCTYIYSNLLGNEAGRMIYDGELLIATAGKIIARSKLLSFKNIILIGVDMNDDKTAIAPLLSKEEEFYHAEGLALFDYLRKSKAKGYTLSLSGGADSTICAVMVYQMMKLAIDELGIAAIKTIFPFLNASNNLKDIMNQVLICAYQGTQNSSKDTFKSAEELSKALGATFYHWTIDEEVNSYTSKIEQVLDKKLTWENDDITLQNIQARARSPIIWMLTNNTGTLLLTTSNRSEGAVGYTTMDGDTSGCLAPIAAVDKHFIRQWLIWAEKALDLPCLNYVNSMAPTAELRPLEQTQTDETDLMPYDVLLDIEKLAIGQHQDPLTVFSTLNEKLDLETDLLKKYIQRFYTLWSRNQWKRERIAPAFHLDDYNVDPRTWCRFPILSSSFKEELEELLNS